MKSKQYFQLATAGTVANLNIYGDITSWPWLESDVSAHNLSKQLADLQDVTQINVYINSYGGEVMEGLAIYNALKRHKAHVTTFCDGSACSIASVIFMAGDERVMCKPSFLMIHDAWTYCAGNAEALRKQADDLETITQASVTAYMEHINISEEELRDLMKAESWLTHSEALEMGFATAVEESSETDKPSQSVKARVFETLAKAFRQAEEDDEEEDEETSDEGDENEAPETPADAPDDSDEEEPGEDEETPESDAEKPSEASDEDEADEDGENNPDPEPAQQWSGFFSAIFGSKVK